jgi:hypothetical protein
MHRHILTGFGTGLLGVCLLIGVRAQQSASSIVRPILTRSGGNLRHGVYEDTVLTPQNVSGLHRLYSIQIPNDARGMESQPLLLPNVKTSDGAYHDLLVLSTMANDVLGCDLKTGNILWRTNLGRPIKSTKAIDFWQLADNQGILSTGVIDPDTQTWYGIAWSSPDGTAAKGWHSLHAVDLRSGNEVKKPLSMNPLTYNPGYGLPVVRFSGQMRKQRAGLLLETVGGRKIIAVAAGSVLETNASASGWVAIADVDAWRFTASWASTSKGYGAGIWQAGQGLVADLSGDLYSLTGNGSFDGVTDFSECFIRLKYTPPYDPFRMMGRLDIVDWWSPYSDSGRMNQDPTLSMPAADPKLAGINAPSASGRLIEPVNQDSNHHMQMMAPKYDPKYKAWGDQDLGSGSIVLLEKQHALLGAGKDGILYSVDQDNMGKTMPQDFANPAANYAKLNAPAVWFTYAAFKHNAQGQVIGYEDPMPQDVTKLDFTYDNLTHHMHSTPVVFETEKYGTVVGCFGENGNYRQWSVNSDGSLKFLGNGQEIASPESPRNRGGMAGGMLAVSENGASNQIVWAIVPRGDANREITGSDLFAYNATNIDSYADGAGWIKTLWRSSVAFSNPKFNVPIISGGYVIVPTYDARVDVYGLN